MFDLFGNIEDQQKAMQEKMAAIVIEHSSDDGKVSVKLNGNKEIMDISISPELFNEERDLEQIEDLLVVTLNEAVEKANIEAEAESRKMITDLMPGLGGLFGEEQ